MNTQTTTTQTATTIRARFERMLNVRGFSDSAMLDLCCQAAAAMHADGHTEAATALRVTAAWAFKPSVKSTVDGIARDMQTGVGLN